MDAAPAVALVELHARPEARTSLLDELVVISRQWAREPDCLGTAVLCDPTDDARLLVLETFTSARALALHRELPGTRAFVDRIRHHLTAAPSATTWAVESQHHHARQPIQSLGSPS
ncbi:antibiotic biosynthesis monooxygenase [Nonomuraea sp. NPDC003804]|uniref:putative quinol monooxygenase n=1 Tax=Nonomuraea sp. NPDC003804 TaxID=3154547 RepID=UPI0033AAED64